MTLFKRLREQLAFWRWYILDYRLIAGGADPAATADPPTPAPEPPAADAPPPEPPAPEPEADPPLGAAGEKALAEFKKRAREAEKLAKEQAERLAKIEEANKTDQERAIDKARKEAAEEVRSEADKELRTERLNSAIARHAAKDFADVDDAIRLLDADDVFDDDGRVDSEKLGKALTGLLEAKPHLKAVPNRPLGGSDAGKGSDPTEPDLESLTPDQWLERKRNRDA